MKRTLLAVAVGALMVSSLAWTHHAASLYDRANPVTFKGVVTEFLFTNPHVQVVFETTGDSGARETWRAGWAPPQRLFRQGVKANSLKPGDEITMACAPAKDGSKICVIQNLIAPGGKVLEGYGENVRPQ